MADLNKAINVFTRSLMWKITEGHPIEQDEIDALNDMRADAGMKPLAIQVSGQPASGQPVPPKPAPKAPEQPYQRRDPEQAYQAPPKRKQRKPDPTAESENYQPEAITVNGYSTEGMLLPEGRDWTNRFYIKSESSGRLYTIAQNKSGRFWGCSCPGWIGHKKCKHLTALGLPGHYQPFEARIGPGKTGSKTAAIKFADDIYPEVAHILAAELIHSDTELSSMMEPMVPAVQGEAHIEGPEAGPSNDELHENSHEEFGVPVTDGKLKSPERPNVTAIKDAIEGKAEMEIGKPIEQKQEEVAVQEAARDEKAMNPSATEVNVAKPGTQIIINVGSKKADDARVNEYLRDMAARGFEPVPETVENLRKSSPKKFSEDWCDTCIFNNPGHGDVLMSSAPGHENYGTCEKCGAEDVGVRPVKKSVPFQAAIDDEGHAVEKPTKSYTDVGKDNREAVGNFMASGEQKACKQCGSAIPKNSPDTCMMCVTQGGPEVRGQVPEHMKHKGSDEGGAWSISGVTPNHETTDDVNKALKRMKAAEGIGGEDDSKITSGQGGGMFGGTDLEGPSFHVGFTFRGTEREASFSSLKEAHSFMKSASAKFGKIAGDWTMKCPHCKQAATKTNREDSYICKSCGWNSHTSMAETSVPKKSKRAASSPSATILPPQPTQPSGQYAYEDISEDVRPIAEPAEPGHAMVSSKKKAEIDMGQLETVQEKKDRAQALEPKKPVNSVTSMKHQKAVPGIPEGQVLVKGYHNPKGAFGGQELRYWKLMDQGAYDRLVKQIMRRHKGEAASNALFDACAQGATQVQPGTSSESIEKQFRTASKSAAADPAKRNLVLELLKGGRRLTTGDIEKALGGGKYSTMAWPVLQELASEGLIAHKQMRWSLKASVKTAEWRGWTEDMPVEVVSDRGFETFPNLAAAKQKYPTLDPQHNTKNFTWAMAGRHIDGKPSIRFETWPANKMYSASVKTAAFGKLGVSIQTRVIEGNKVTPEVVANKLNDLFQDLKRKNPQGFMDSFEQQLPSFMMDIANALHLQVDYTPEDDTYMFFDQQGGTTKDKKFEEFEQVSASLKTAMIHVTSAKPMPRSGTPEFARLQIAIQTMKMPDAMANVMGGPGREDSEKTLAEYGLRWDEESYMNGGKGVKKAGDGMAKTEKELEKEAGFNFFFPGQVVKEFYPEIQHEIVDYPNANNQPMGLESPEIVGDGGHELEGVLDEALDTSVVEMIQLPADVGGLEEVHMSADYSSTSPAGGMGIGRDGKPEVLEGAPLRKENDIRGQMFTDEFYGQYEGIPGAAMAVASKTAAEGDETKQFAMFLKRVCGEIAATLVAAYKVTARPLLDKVPGMGELQLDIIEQGNGAIAQGQTTQGGRVKWLMDKLNDGDIKSAINEAWAQAAVWNDNPNGGFVYEVFVRPETIDTDSLVMKYKFVCGTRE